MRGGAPRRRTARPTPCAIPIRLFVLLRKKPVDLMISSTSAGSGAGERLGRRVASEQRRASPCSPARRSSAPTGSWRTAAERAVVSRARTAPSPCRDTPRRATGRSVFRGSRRACGEPWPGHPPDATVGPASGEDDDADHATAADLADPTPGARCADPGAAATRSVNGAAARSRCVGQRIRTTTTPRPRPPRARRRARPAADAPPLPVDETGADDRAPAPFVAGAGRGRVGRGEQPRVRRPPRARRLDPRRRRATRGRAVVRSGRLPPPPRPGRPGGLAGFVLDEGPRRRAAPALGEIYVIGVDPDFDGRKLGERSRSPGSTGCTASRHRPSGCSTSTPPTNRPCRLYTEHRLHRRTTPTGRTPARSRVP